MIRITGTGEGRNRVREYRGNIDLATRVDRLDDGREFVMLTVDYYRGWPFNMADLYVLPDDVESIVGVP